jgi:hypothetical protein
MNVCKYFIALLLVAFCSRELYAQSDIIEIDTLTGSAAKVMPYNRPFTIKMQIDAEEVDQIFFTKKYRSFDFNGSLAHNIKDSGGQYTVREIPGNYYYVRKIGDRNTLLLTFADNFLLEPSSAYYVIILQKKLGGSAIGFFDNFYLSEYGSVANRARALADATDALREFEAGMRKVFGNAEFAYYTEKKFSKSPTQFKADFDRHLLPVYTAYINAETTYSGSIPTNAGTMAGSIPEFDSVTYKQLFTGSSVNKDVIAFISAKDMALNAAASDINTIAIQGRIATMLNGTVSLDCIHCTPVNANSTLQNDFIKRVSNIDASINVLNNLKKVLFLLKPISTATSNITLSITRIINWISFLQTSKSELRGLLRLRKSIESKIIENIFDGTSFNYASMASGNSYLNFETRNKVLITPDFGITTSAITKEGKKLEYGIVPYLGFHLNLMAVDKDISFKSYKKNWKQYTSLMVGWSMVNMKQDSTYDNFFEKSSLLTGAGFRINNTIRLTAGAQWLFKFGKDAANNRTKKLQAYPFLGLSIDFNMKQYLNGFTDLLSGIGKTKLPKPTPTIIPPQ